MERIRVLIVDDSAVIRRLLTGALQADPDLEVVASAVNGRDALVKVKELKPDLVLCDVEMPEMDGVTTVQALRRGHYCLPVIMFSSPTVEGARTTLDCLHAGANDFMTKPSFTAGTAMDSVLVQLRNDLGAKIKALCRGPGDLSGIARQAVSQRIVHKPASRTPVVGLEDAPSAAPPQPLHPQPPPVLEQRRILRPRPQPTPATPSEVPAVRPRPTPTPPTPSEVPVIRLRRPPVTAVPAADTPSSPRPAFRRGRIEAVLVGISTGGPNALSEMVPYLPRDLPVPVLIVQHMPPVFTRLLAERLATRSQLAVREAAAGDPVVAGTVLLAPGDQHLAVRRDGTGVRCVLNRDPPENSVRPAADVLFRSAAEVWGGNVLVVIMTGMGQDGLLGAVLLDGLGAQIIAQDEATSVVWGMPGAVAKAGIADRIVPLNQIADEIAQRARGAR